MAQDLLCYSYNNLPFPGVARSGIRQEFRSLCCSGIRQEFRSSRRIVTRLACGAFRTMDHQPRRNSWRIPLRVLGVLCLINLFFLATTNGQEVNIAQQRGPYYVGEPMVIQVQVNGVQSEQDVVCRLGQSQLPAGISVEGPEIGQSKSSFTQIINGRIISRETVNFVYNFQVTAERAGPASVGPFTVEIDSQPQQLDALVIEFEELEEDPDMELEFSLPRSKIYVGEQVPVSIVWRFAGDRNGLQFAFSNLQIRSPLFEQFTFVDSQPSSRTTLSIATAQGIVEVDATVDKQSRGDQDFVVLTGQRTLLANTPGDFHDIPASCRTQRVTRWGRDLFGDARPVKSSPALARAQPLSFSVLPIPTANRPASYSGAVGSGFGIEVAASRSVVRVGDPIVLDVTLTGDGDLERCSLPRLSTSLNEDLFQLPNEEPVGQVIGNAKQFKVNIGVKTSTVTQLPSIEFAWFDPLQEKFLTTHSKPIALQVNAAQVVSAADVVSSRPARADANTANEGTATSNNSNPSTTRPALQFVGANLAIEKNLPSLVVTPSLLLESNWLAPTLYLLGLGLIALGLVSQRLRAKSPRLVQRQAILKQTRASVRRAERQTPRDATNSIASALRQLLATCSEGDRTSVDTIIAECEQLGFAPAHHDDSLQKEDLIARALQAIDIFARKPPH